MFRKKERRFTGAHAIAIAALFFALGGGAYAAVNSLPPNSVGSEQLRNHAVTPPKLSKETIKQIKKIAKLYAGKPGIREIGPSGPKGDRGETGPTGPSDVYIGGAAGGSLSGSYAIVASTQVPPGDYLIEAKTEIFNGTLGEGGEGGCEILPDLSGGAWDAGSVALPAVPGQFAAESLALTGAASLPNGSNVALACKENAGALSIDDARVWAIKVGSLHGLPVPID